MMMDSYHLDELGSRIKNKMSDFGIEDLTLPDEDLGSITLPPIGDTGGSPELRNHQHLLIIQVMKLMN